MITLAENILKRCPRCETEKSLDQFGKDKSRRYGVYHTCRPCVREAYQTGERLKRLANPDKMRDRTYRTKYGISLSEYRVLSTNQGDCCAICNRPDPRGMRLSVDHDHRTGEVRGLLCQNCNAGIGMFMDNPDLLRAAISYLSAEVAK